MVSKELLNKIKKIKEPVDYEAQRMHMIYVKYRNLGNWRKKQAAKRKEQAK